MQVCEGKAKKFEKGTNFSCSRRIYDLCSSETKEKKEQNLTATKITSHTHTYIATQTLSHTQSHTSIHIQSHTSILKKNSKY